MKASGAVKPPNTRLCLSSHRTKGEFMTPFCFATRVAFFGMVAALGTAAAGAQSFPSRPIRIITSEAGGGNDFATRIIAQGLAAPLGQQVIVENRQATIGPAIVKTALPDGYTLILSGSNFWISPLMRNDAPYDPVRDFSPITAAVSSPNILVVHPSLPVTSVKELVALLKSRPGAFNYASSSVGGSPQLAGELFKAMAGLNIVAVQYKGSSQALTGLVSGEAHLMFASASSIAPHVKGGRLRALAVTSAQPSELLPGMPTVAASVPGYEYLSSFGILAPARTPAAIISRLNKEIVQTLHQKEIKEKLMNAGLEVIGSSPAELAARIKSEMMNIGKMIKDAGIKAE